VNLRKYLILAGVVIFGPCGDLLLSRGMKAIGAISFSNFHQLFGAVFNPWVATGICFLIVFFVSYLTALSWADLTYVLPASALGYVLIALLAHYCLHENVTVVRWLGILLITGGVGFVAGGPVVTTVVEDPSLQEVER
jgi:drug/metabolite transporter (DMT)-like permease